MTEYAFVTVDVFTTERFGGNPLAVFPNARGLTTDQMARIAREFNYSETTFVLPPQDPANTANVRIFTPTAEVPFAGHPNVGTGFVLAQLGKVFEKPVGDAMIFEELAGLVAVSVKRNDGAVTTSITAPGKFTSEPIPDGVNIAACVSLEPSDILATNHPPLTIGVGLSITTLEVRDVETLARCKPDIAAFELADSHMSGLPGGVAVFVYTRVSDDPLVVQARMFAPLDNIPEDPATGSASAALGALLASLRPKGDLDLHVSVRQGYEMGRPSYIELDVTRRAGEITRVDISGSCVNVLQGTLTI